MSGFMPMRVDRGTRLLGDFCLAMVLIMRWNKEAVRSFLDRDWNLFERAPLELDSARSEELAGALYEQIRAANPDWPTPLDRDQDLAAHLHLVEVFARIHDAQRRRFDAG